MNKIAGLYQSYLREREDEFREYCAGGDKLNELQEFLKIKLNADDYFTAEEMLHNLITEIEGKGFEAGAKYTAGLGVELMVK